MLVKNQLCYLVAGVGYSLKYDDSELMYVLQGPVGLSGSSGTMGPVGPRGPSGPPVSETDPVVKPMSVLRYSAC